MGDIFGDLEPIENAPELSPSEEVEFSQRHGNSIEHSYDPILEKVGLSKPDKRLSINEMNFAVAFAQHGDATAAYRTAFADHENLSPKSIHTMASRLARRPIIADEIAKHRELGAKVAALTLPNLIDKLVESIDIARDMKDPKAVQSGIKLIAEMLGKGMNNEAKQAEAALATSLAQRLDVETETRVRELIISRSRGDDAIDITPVTK